ncbi:hypothetical protein IWX90DRAFT_428314 [Phyllosticta citrichinensis]|uniref:Early meiotic induction protein 1 n=1 Tax=Phyllosticta citrichinensis TaxID=1130410 RepID=A0ABR1Y0E5_9PEZI
MGWPWRSNNQSQTPSQASDAPAVQSPPTVNPNSVDAALGQQQQQQQQPQQLTREQQADAELQSFLNELSASTKTKTASPSSTNTTTPADDNDTSPKGKPSPLTDSSYPTTMSCRDAFDYAFHCQSLGGQLTNWYRFGTLRSCSDRWDDFWFCMRTRGYGAEERAREITAHFAEKEKRYKKAPSSEDVWEQRRLGEELKNPFMRDPDLIEIPGLPKRKKSADEA